MIKYFHLITILGVLGLSAQLGSVAESAEKKTMSRRPSAKRPEKPPSDSCAKLKTIAENAMVGNGTADVQEGGGRRYSQPFDFRAADAAVFERFKSRTHDVDTGKALCGQPKDVRGRRYAIKHIGSDSFGADPDTAKALLAVRNAGGIVAIVGAEWRGQEGDGWDCSIYYYDIYSPDGCILSLDIENTD